MCARCDGLIVDATVIATLRHAERRLILAQSDAGESVPHATRPLTAAERRAKMRFSEIEKLETSAAEKAAKLLASNAQVYIMAVIGAIFGEKDTADSGQVVEAFERLNRAQPKAAVEEVARSQSVMSTILREVFAGGSLIAIGEAIRQGVKNVVKPQSAAADQFDSMARAVALHPWTRLTSKLQAELLNPKSLAGPVQRADVKKTLEDIPIDGAVDLARQSINTAHGAGRYETMAPMNPDRIYASELLDGATCDACEKVDGKEYGALEDALVEYERGGYGACKGGARCRGTLVAVYRDGDAAPSTPKAPPAPPPEAPKPAPRNATPKAKAGPLANLPQKKQNTAPTTKEEAQAEAWKVNPSYKDGREYQVNCSNAVTAHELRRRGYDVTAAPGGAARNVLKFTTDWWRKADGSKPLPKMVETLKGARAEIADWPEGARGYVNWEWNQGGGHVISVEKVNGKVVWTEPQKPGQVVGSQYWQNMKQGTLILTRVDDLVPTDAVLQAVRPAGKGS